MMKSTKLAAALVLALGSGAAAAYSIQSPSTTGSVILWAEGPAGVLAPSSSATLIGVLAGDSTTPGGNVELSKFGGPVSTLTGTLNGNAITLSSLTMADWFVGGNATALTTSYISGAYKAAFGTDITASQLSTAVAGFGTANATLGGRAPYQLVSDPNISYVLLNNDAVTIGLAGLLNAGAFLKTIDPSAPATAYASEVVKVTYNGATSYLYSFAQPGVSGVHAQDGVSYAGDYPVTLQVPEPASMSLVALGLGGLAALRRRRT